MRLIMALMLCAACIPGVMAAEAVPILLYHGITSSEVTPATFDAQMAALKSAGYVAVTDKQVADFLAGTGTLPSKPFLITFDDGRDASYYPADPVLAEYGYTATMFVISKHSTKPTVSYYLNKSEVQDMLDTGRWRVEAHGHDAHEYRQVSEGGATGPFLTYRLWLGERMETDSEYRDRIDGDMDTVNSALAQNFSIPITTFAYPFGQYGQLKSNVDALRHIAEETDEHYARGYYQTFNGEGFSHNYPGMHALLAKRITVDDDWSGSELLSELSRGTPKSRTYTDTLSPDKGWELHFGNIDIASGILTLEPESSNNAAAAYLDGTYHWDDYTYNASVKKHNNATIILTSRLEDPNNYLACAFEKASVKAYQVTDGVWTRLAEKSSKTLPISNIALAMTVNGNAITCNRNGIILKTVVETPVENGGVGLRVEGTGKWVKLEDVKIKPV